MAHSFIHVESKNCDRLKLYYRQIGRLDPWCWFVVMITQCYDHFSSFNIMNHPFQIWWPLTINDHRLSNSKGVSTVSSPPNNSCCLYCLCHLTKAHVASLFRKRCKDSSQCAGQQSNTQQYFCESPKWKWLFDIFHIVYEIKIGM